MRRTAGLLWKHYDGNLGTTETRRSRRLVISFILTADNYEYAIYWYFYQDGSIEFEVKLTGIVLTSALPPGETSDFGTLVAPQTLAAHHQHFLSMRLDMAVDGLSNTVYEVDTEAVPPGPGNPLGNAFRPVRRPLRRESEAQRVTDPSRARYWLVGNPGIRTGLGHEPAYKLVPSASALAFSHPDASANQRARFATKHLWVTPFSPDERYPAGDYPNQHPGDAGLPGLDQGRPPDREHRRGALVHRGQPSCHQARGLAGHARRTGRVHAEARRLLRSEPGARRGPRLLLALLALRYDPRGDEPGPLDSAWA